MFDITPNDISQLNDVDLRELVGRLCEAELVSRGLSPAAVTWGGSQTAADGGLDVRVALPPDVLIEGFVPRPATGFQVKTPDMPRAAILAEMRPADVVRPVIRELANERGAYVIVSSKGSTADSALRNRRDALREALNGVTTADQLYTDFYDRTRLATWVRRHPGLITWVREKAGRALIGWRPYGPWSSVAEDADAEYLLDDKLRLHLARHGSEPPRPVEQVIDELRDELANPGKIVRLVGLSGVGKTRLVQALFDARIGSRPLPPSRAVYTNLSDNPDPQPTGLASDLIANHACAVLIVDNCPPDLHRRLSELCSGHTSTVSVLTVEYDVRDDQPEGTQVVTLDTSSPELIEKLVQRRFPHLSQVDSRTIADASGGNARIAIALAETVERSETIAGLSNDDLFQRLFRQRHDSNDALLLAAQTCSLVYSFQGQALEGEEAELPRLATLAGQAPVETYRHVGELLRRDLVQKRGVWRAVLPHAIANRLAARALEDTPHDLINQQLVEGGTERLARSFSRRLSYLHGHSGAVTIVQSWLAPGGLLGDVGALNELGRAMFENVAPVLPEAALAALERVRPWASKVATKVWWQHRSLLRSLAYDPPLFERSVKMLAQVATGNMVERDAKEALDTFVSLFTIHLSGTYATIEQRLGVIEKLMRSGEAKERELGLAALQGALKTALFSSAYPFEFGARSRDFGYQARNRSDVCAWYGASLKLIEHLVLAEGLLKSELRELAAQNFPGLWTRAHMYLELEQLFRNFAADGFWREGWVACRRTMVFDRDRLTPEAAARLSALEADLRPSTLSERVRAVVLGDRRGWLVPEDVDVEGDLTSASQRSEAIAHELGVAVATDDEVFEELLPDLLHGGSRTFWFGRGLATASQDAPGTWSRLVQALGRIPLKERNVGTLTGFLAEVWERDKELAQDLLDSALEQPALQVFLPMLHTAVELDERGVERLKRALNAGHVPASMFRALVGQTADHLPGGILKDLLLSIAGLPDGFDVALEILYHRFHLSRSTHRKHEPELLEAGRDLVRRVAFRRNNQRDDYQLAKVVETCLTGPDAGPIAAEAALRLRQAVEARETYSYDIADMLRALLEVQSAAVLDALFSGDERDQRAGLRAFDRLSEHRANPADAISCDALITWCEGEREPRYPLAASIITFSRRPDESGPQVWSEQAKALLANAPDFRSVLEVFIDRFQPMSWSGSRAAILEANSQLLDSLDSIAPSGFRPFVAEAKAQLSEKVAQGRRDETEQDRGRDERFE